ncbi:MAG TPA: DUF3857 domain-containing protein [Terriglobales bacterium]|nr:DUF3857 domain-containing protein [Terriglobales bacterium]
MSRTIACILTCAFGLSLLCGASENQNNGFSATPRQLLESAADVKADKSAEIATSLAEYTFQLDAQSRLTYKVHRIFRIESQDSVEDWSSVSVYYSPWRQDRPEIRVRVINPDGSQHVLDPKVLVDAPTSDDSEANVYDDNRLYQGPIPSVSVGSIVEQEIVIRDREPLFAGGIGRTVRVGSRYGPVERTVVLISAPASLPVKYVTRLLPNIAMEKKQTDETVEYRFEQGRMEMLEKAEDNLPGDIPASPYLAFSTGSSWKQIADTYNALVEAKIRLADVESLVRKSIKTTDSREQKIKKLFALLHKNVRYTGVEFADAALIPAFPGETLKRGYGDCKDKATLLVAMLRAAGVPAHLALLTTGPGEDNEPHLPAMDFDHAIVYVPGTPDIWIDATASRYQVGPIPPSDAGRLSLIVREGTTELVRIPENKPEDNLLLEKREFFLAEYGPSKIVETSLPSGIAEANYRSYYPASESKDLKEGLTDYVSSTYLAEKLTAYSYSEAADLNTPFQLKLEVGKGRRGFTDLDDAVVAVLPGDITSRFPSYLRGEDEELSEKEKADKEKKPRQADFVFTPFITEWHYRVVPPIGFKVRALPENTKEQFGPATFSSTYSEAADGSVLANYRFDTVKGRYTAVESESLRSALRQFRGRSAITINLGNAGHLLMTSGKIREGLIEFEKVAATHPKEALHKIQLASAMLGAGLCEVARKYAREATLLEPTSARAYQMLGWVLQHDLVCRRLQKGFDYAGSVAAYKKAKELVPDEMEYRLDLAILYEHGSEGYQYSPSSQLNDAIAEWREIGKLSPKTAKSYENNLLFDLMYASRFKELQEELANVSMDVTHRAMLLVAIVGQAGTAAALEKAMQITSDENSRSNVLVTAGNYLLRLRKYPECAEMLAAGSKGQPDSAGTLQRADLLRRTKPYQQVIFPDSDPRSVLQKVMVEAIKNPEGKNIFKLVAALSMRGLTPDELLEKSRSRRESGATRSTLKKSGLPPETIIDLGLSNAQFHMEGDDNSGYRITMQAVGSKNQVGYVVREQGEYRLLAFGSEAVEDLAAEALGRLDRGDTEGARKLLDWARSDISIGSGDDPLSGEMFPRLWTRGDKADLNTMRTAALSAVGKREDSKRWVPQLIEARNKATSDSTKAFLERSLATAYTASYNFTELRASALRLLAAYPKSDSALLLLGAACAKLKDWDTWNKAIQSRLSSVPDDAVGQRQLAYLYSSQSKLEEANDILRKLLASSDSTAEDMNLFGWNELLMGKITEEGIQHLRRGISIQKGYGIVHTLASIYAENGNAGEARQLVLGIMDDNGMDEPDDNLWYVFGRIAEIYGQPDAAMACYKRVHWKEKYEPDPGATYVLAQKRLQGLPSVKEAAVGAK